MNKSRRQFEAMAIKRGLSIDKKKDNWGQEKYKYDMIQIMWEGWQASRESLEVKLPNVSGIPHTNYDCGYRDGIEKCENILIRNGVKIKNE